MASNDSSVPEQLLQNLKKLASQMQESGLRPTKIKQTTELAEQYVALFSQYAERLETAQKESDASLAQRQEELETRLDQRQEELDTREEYLGDCQAQTDAARVALDNEETLAQLGVDVGKIQARYGEFKEDLLSSNEKTAAETTKTRTEVTESEGRLAAALKSCGAELEARLQECLDAISSCDSKLEVGLQEIREANASSEGSVTGALSACEQNLANKMDGTLTAVSSCKDMVKELGEKTNGTVSSCHAAVLEEGKLTRESVSSGDKALGEKLDGAMKSWSTDLAHLSGRVNSVTSSEGPLMKSIKHSEGFVQEMGQLLAGHIDEMSGSLREEHRESMEQLGQKVANARAHLESLSDSKSKESVDEVKTALGSSASEISTALGDMRARFAELVGEERLSSIFDNSARAGEILDRLEGVHEAVAQPDTSVSEAVSELGGMLQGLNSTLQHVESLTKALEDAQNEAMVAKTGLDTCRDERDRLAKEVDRLTSDMNQLKTKMPVTPMRSVRDKGSDDSTFSPGSVFEQELAKVADAAEQPSGPSVGDLQQRIQELENELRLSKESRQEVSENLVSKKYLDDALASMAQTLSLRDRNEVQTVTGERASQIAELEKKVKESAKRAEEAEKECRAMRDMVNELTDQVSALETQREAAAPGENEPRSRKRARLQQASSSAADGAEETMFSSMCSAIHEAMRKVNIKQQNQPGLPVADIVANMTRAFAFVDREERLTSFIRSDRTGELFCFGSLVLSDEPSTTDCICNRLQGGMVRQCLSLRVLDPATMDVEFGLVDIDY